MDTIEIDRLMSKKISDLQIFRENQKELWELVNAGYLVSEGLIRCTALLPEPTMIETHRTIMWWTVLDYQMEGFFLCVNRQLDLGLASIRLACELARDIARIGSDETKLKLWFDRTNRETRKQYRIDFRFDDSDHLEKLVHELYDLSSTFGIHGHALRSSSLRPLKFINDGKHVVLDVPDTEVFKILQVWMAAFYPIHALCSRCFIMERKDHLREPYRHFQNMWGAFNPVFEEYRRNLKAYNADVVGHIQ